MTVRTASRHSEVAGRLLAALVLVAVCEEGCAAPYSPSCRVADETYLVREAALPLGVSGRAAPRLRLDHAGALEATWLSTMLLLKNNVLVPTVTRGDVVFATADGARVRRAATAAPHALQDRRGSTVPLGAYALPEGLLFPWVEEDVFTMSDGARQSKSQLRSQIVRWDGTEGELVAPADGSCQNCTLSVAIAHGGRSVVLLVRMQFADGGRKLFYVHSAFDGALPRTDELVWARQEPPDVPLGEADAGAAAATSPFAGFAIDFLGDGYVITGEGSAHLYDEAMHPLQKDLALAVPYDASVQRVDGRLLFGWPESVDASHAFRDDSAIGRGEGRALYFARRDENTAALVSPPQRISVGAVVLGVTNFGMTLRTADASDYFARFTESGEKIGGDIPLSSVPGATDAALSLALGSAEQTSFVDYRVGAGIVFRRSIVCGD